MRRRAPASWSMARFPMPPIRGCDWVPGRGRAWALDVGICNLSNQLLR